MQKAILKESTNKRKATTLGADAKNGIPKFRSVEGVENRNFDTSEEQPMERKAQLERELKLAKRMVESAKQSLRDDMKKEGNQDDAEQVIEKVFKDPLNYIERDNSRGKLARCLKEVELKKASLVQMTLDDSDRTRSEERMFSTLQDDDEIDQPNSSSQLGELNHRRDMAIKRLKHEMVKAGNGDDVEEEIECIRKNPEAYVYRDNSRGILAKCFQDLAKLQKTAVPSSSIAQEDASPSLGNRLADHKYFVPLSHELYADAPEEHHFSHLNIDPTLSKFGPEENEMVRILYQQLVYKSKEFPCKEIPGDGPPGTRGPFFTLREYDFKPPESRNAHTEILIFGPTQLSKTLEACITCYFSFFVDGSLPVMCIRNKGGRGLGSTDMKNGIEKVNKMVSDVFEHAVKHKLVNLKLADVEKFKLYPRIASNREYIEFDTHSNSLTRPQVLIQCMNHTQLKSLTGIKPAVGTEFSLFEIMKGMTRYPYPPKCNDPYKPFDQGVNRPVARLTFVLDEDDLNRSNTVNVTERFQFSMNIQERSVLSAGLSINNRQVSNCEEQRLDDEDDSCNDSFIVSEEEDDEDDEETDGVETSGDSVEIDSCQITGVRSAVRGVIAFTATPGACGHDLGDRASCVYHQVYMMQHPSNYVGYEFTAAKYAERTIKHESVPDRKQIVAIQKSLIYKAILQQFHWWDTDGNKPRLPFKQRSNGLISVRQTHLDDVKRHSGKSSSDIYSLVQLAHNISGQRREKVLESDGVGIAMMLKSMSENGDHEELERRGLIMSNFTRTLTQKDLLANHILEGHLYFEDGEEELPMHCIEDLFVIVLDHRLIRIKWRNTSNNSTKYEEVIEAMNAASNELTCGQVDNRRTSPWSYDSSMNMDTDEEQHISTVESKCCNINHVYSALLLYAHNRRKAGDKNFKLKSVVLAGELAGRGVNFKPHGVHHPCNNKQWIIPPHEGYLTDMFFMFDASRNSQIATHGEYVIQAIGRLCGLTTDEYLAKMQYTPPRLWTSNNCYKLIEVFSRTIQEWVVAIKNKKPGESIKDALIRCIKNDPEGFDALNLTYTTPTNDRRFSSKDVFIRHSRLAKQERSIGEEIREVQNLPQCARSFGIHHDPIHDTNERVKKSVTEALTRFAKTSEVAYTETDDVDFSTFKAWMLQAHRSTIMESTAGVYKTCISRVFKDVQLKKADFTLEMLGSYASLEDLIEAGYLSRDMRSGYESQVSGYANFKNSILYFHLYSKSNK